MLSMVRDWWALTFRGLLAIAFGVLAFAFANITVEALTLFFGGYAFADGVCSLSGAFRRHRRDQRRGTVGIGILGILVGLVTALWPELTMLALISLIGAWAIVRGILEIAAAIRLSRILEREWILGTLGIASVVFGVGLILFPVAGAIALGWLVGVYSVAYGILLVRFSFKMRSLSQTLDHVVTPSPRLAIDDDFSQQAS